MKPADVLIEDLGPIREPGVGDDDDGKGRGTQHGRTISRFARERTGRVIRSRAMSVATYDQLRAAAGPMTEGRVKLAKSLRGKNLFLSHSSIDVDRLPSAIGLLEKHGADVYVDVQDAGIRGMTDPEIAARLRDAIGSCKRLVVLFTEHTPTSRWIPWELGVADGRRGREEVALLPARARPGSPDRWANEGYFEIYPRVEILKKGGVEFWAVKDPADGKHWRLEAWIAL